MAGLIHLYCGDGKGKTTASVGLAVRAAGAGRRVLFTQFMKDGTSAELKMLAGLPGLETAVCHTAYGFYLYMSDEERQAARRDYTALLERAIAACGAGDVDLLVLDEAVSACNTGLIPEERLAAFLAGRPETLEVVLTGRDPSARLLALADYVTEMRKIKHPYDSGVSARRGIEY